MKVDGQVAEGFEPVREVFERGFSELGDLGAATAAYVDGRKVVDLWGGIADPETERVWLEDTIVPIFSSTKGVTAVLANRLADQGLLDMEAPVVDVWPEFAAEGKDNVPVEWLLCHKAGLIDVDGLMTVDDLVAWDPVVEALARQEPFWEPGSAHGYHAVTYGWLAGEVIRRVAGRTPGQVLAEEVADPLGLDTWIGMPGEVAGRLAALQPIDELTRIVPDATNPSAGSDESAADDGGMAQLFGPDSLLVRALTAPGRVFRDQRQFNDPRVLAAELPGAAGVSDARSLARMYAACIGEIDGVRLLSDHQVRQASFRRTEGSDRCLVVETGFGLGFMTSTPFSRMGSRDSFGHAGMGGSVGFADPRHGVAFAYVMNDMRLNLTGDERSRALIEALYEAVGHPRPWRERP